MALVTQTIAADQLYVPYERPPQALTLWSAIPRGIFTLSSNAGLTTKPINDDFTVIINGTLPPNYGYVFESIHFSIQQDVAGSWGATVLLNLQNFFRGLPVGINANLVFPFVNTDRSGTTSCIAFNSGSSGVGTSDVPTFPLVAPEGTSGVLTSFSGFNNQNPASSGGTLHYWLSFWQFDLEQIRKYPINSPLPVQAR